MSMGMSVVNEEQKSKGKEGRVRESLQWGSVASEGTHLYPLSYLQTIIPTPKLTPSHTNTHPLILTHPLG